MQKCQNAFFVQSIFVELLFLSGLPYEFVRYSDSMDFAIKALLADILAHCTVQPSLEASVLHGQDLFVSAGDIFQKSFVKRFYESEIEYSHFSFELFCRLKRIVGYRSCRYDGDP